jgi:hypothetical protein
LKRWLWYIGIVVAVAVLSGKPSVGKDVGKLQPVQVVRLFCPQGRVCLETDTGDLGSGDSLKDALADMKNTTPGEVFLDTADFLIVSPECVDLLPAMMQYLRPSCSVCIEKGKPDMERVGLYLQNHSPDITLMQYRAGVRNLRTLATWEGRMCLVS